MNADFVTQAPGLQIEAWHSVSGDGVPFAGLLVEFDSTISREMRGIALETALRYWQRNVGSVRRGARADLAGWRVMLTGKGRIARMRLSSTARETSDDRVQADRAGQPAVPGDDEGAQCP